MPSKNPLWRQLFDTVERSVASPLESVVRSELFFDVVAVAARARRGVTARTERASRRALHLINLPAGSDMRRASDQLARLERGLLLLSKQIDDAVADDAVADDAVPDDAVADDAVADDVVPDGAVADGAVADGAVADGAVPDGAVPDDAVADDAVAHRPRV